VAELVQMAGALPFTTVDGKPGVVRDAVKPEHLEMALRERAKTLGVTLLEHRAMSDVGGVKAEAMAILANLGKIPTEAEFGGDSAKITVSIFGKIAGEAELGKAKVEGEASAEGVEGSVKFPGGKVGVGVSGEGITADVSAGDLVKVKGKVGHEKDGGAFWKAEITIGTIGHVVTPAEVAKVMKGAQDTFGESAAALVKGLDDPAKIKEHGGALKDAVTEVVEKAKKSASQKPGWSVGLEAKGTESGGFSGSVTFTWVF
jgi:hypothetical protein